MNRSLKRALLMFGFAMMGFVFFIVPSISNATVGYIFSAALLISVWWATGWVIRK